MEKITANLRRLTVTAQPSGTTLIGSRNNVEWFWGKSPSVPLFSKVQLSLNSLSHFACGQTSSFLHLISTTSVMKLEGAKWINSNIYLLQKFHVISLDCFIQIYRVERMGQIWCFPWFPGNSLLHTIYVNDVRHRRLYVLDYALIILSFANSFQIDLCKLISTKYINSMQFISYKK